MINKNIENNSLYIYLNFTVKSQTKLGQNVFIIGNIPELGDWNPSKAFRLSTNKNIYPEWKSK